jgi:multidrug resistance efflux pump
MARVNRLSGGALGVATMVVIVAVALWLTPSRQMSSAQDRERSDRQPLISRGYTDATTGTVVIAGDPGGGQTILELRIKDGQTVKRDEIIAVLSNYPRADILVRSAEADLEKIKQLRQTMLTGSRVTQIAMQEAAVRTTIEENKLQALGRQRSGKPPKEKELEVSIAERGLENQKATLELQKRMLANDLSINAIDIANAEAKLENARRDREAALVRSPLDGVVVQIYTRQGELIPGRPGIAKIVDMRQLRVLADVDELHLGRLVPGAKVEITFRGSSRVYTGKVVRAPMTVTRLKRSNADLGLGSAHLVEAEIAFDDPTSIPQMLEREARVTFL